MKLVRSILAVAVCVGMLLTLRSISVFALTNVGANDTTAVAVTEESAAEDTLLKGDVNGDGAITSGDARMLLRYVVGQSAFSEPQLAAGDVNGDGSVTSADARAVLMALVA